MISEEVDTKYGTAVINPYGYLQLTTFQHNKSRLVHRRVWEDFYNKPVPKNCVIHHLNGDKLDNRIQNLQCCLKTNHIKFHSKNKSFNHSDEFKKIRSDRYTGKGNPMYGKKRSREEMSGIISYKLKSSKLSFFDEYYGLVYLMHRKHKGLTQKQIISEMGLSSGSYISQKLNRLNMKWGDL